MKAFGATCLVRGVVSSIARGNTATNRRAVMSFALPDAGRAVAILIGLAVASLTRAGAASADSAQVSAALTPTGGRITVQAEGVAPVAPVFFTARVDESAKVGLAEVTGEARVSIRVLQGRPDVLSLALIGEGDVVGVAGTGLRDWSVRRTGETQRFLDLRIASSANQETPSNLELTVQFRRPGPIVPGPFAMLLVSGGEAVGLEWRGRFTPDPSVDLQVSHATGLVLVNNDDGTDRGLAVVNRGDPVLELMVARRGASVLDAELTKAQLEGRLNEAGSSVEFHFRGQARVGKEGARLRFLSGAAAWSGATAGDGWHAELSSTTDEPAYELVFDRKGLVPIELDFVGAIREDGDWRRLDFRVGGAAVVPLAIKGLPKAVDFDRGAAVVLADSGSGWQGFLPADGRASLGWRTMRGTSEGALFFTSTELTELRVAAGLMRQSSQIAFRIMQGKLGAVKLRVEGPGEIVGVDGTNLLGWRVVSNGDARVLEVQLSRPFETQGVLTVQSQLVLGGFPLKAEPLRLVPEGGVRHSGFVRIANTGAVRLEVADVDGMMQLAPSQYPGTAIEPGARQVFVYRFPAAARGFHVLASQILPEVGISQIVTYGLAEADRFIEADLELDIREAALRDWSLAIPSDFAVAAVDGADVSDYSVETSTVDNRRGLKVFFARPVVGRELVHIRLEKNQAAAAGEWALPELRFPGAKSVRGHVGVTSVAGYRMVPIASDRIVDVPLSFFPKPMQGLQQAFRIREPGWAATLRIEALGQSVQADVFHLYSLKQGAVFASVLLNYFVVGAPANEWRIEVPANAGNIDVTGQGVRREWRREGNTIVVTLHQPVLGAATLLVTFELPMSPRGGVIDPGEVRPIGVQAERGYVQVVSPLQVKTEIQKAEGSLLKLEQLELPTELRLLSNAPSLAVYQYTARPFALRLGVNWYQPSDTIDQVVDFATFRSHVAADGQVVTEARMFVKTRGRNVLRFVLPPGAKLWETRVDDQLVTARADGAWTLVPLSARLNPNEPVPVALRLGQAAGTSSRRVVLEAPRMAIPMVMGEWNVRGDPGRLLVAGGGSAEVIRPNLAERGFEWIAAQAGARVIVLLLLAALALLLLRTASGPRAFLAMGAGGIAFWLALSLAVDAAVERRMNRLDIDYAATVVPADGTVSLQVANVPGWQAMISTVGVVAFTLGAVLLGFAKKSARPVRVPAWLTMALGVVLTGAGLLAQRLGAVPFFAVVAVAILLVLLVPAAQVAWLRWAAWRNRRAPAGPGSPATAVSILLMGALLGGALARPAKAWAETKPAPTAVRSSATMEAIVQRWEIREHRLIGEMDVTVRGIPGDSFLFLRAPAVLTSLAGEGLRATQIETDGPARYYLVLDRGGTLTARARFELPVTEPMTQLPVLTGPATLQRITIELDQPGWEFTSSAAMEVQPIAGLAANRSGATLVLRPGDAPLIKLSPKRRDVSTEAAQFYAEVTNLFMPGPGAVNAAVRVAIKPTQGRVSDLQLRVPDGFSVGDVTHGPVGTWRFDPEKRSLRVSIEPAQADSFSFTVELQQGIGALPFDLTLHPLRVVGANREVGMIGVALGGDAQAEGMRPTGLANVTVDDFDRDLVPRGRDRQPLLSLQTAYRYSGDDAALTLRVTPVAPEVRVATRQLLSLGDDRVVLVSDLAVSITRVGLFQLSFALPKGMEIEAVSGAALSHWTEAEEAGQRIITLHLNGRTLGEQNFALTLVGPVPTGLVNWRVPEVRLREATRQTGELQVVPEKGIRLRAIERRNVSELDPRTVGNTRPGALAFKVLEEDWALTLGVEALDPWITVQSLEEVTAREGQTLTRLALRYRIENAAVKQLRVRLPGLSEEQTKTVRATGPAVSDLVPVPGEAGVWQIRFQRGVIGETALQIEFQGPAAREDGRQPIATPVFDGVRQATQFVAVRGGGRLELDAPELPRGWQRADWSAVPTNLQDRSDRSVPALTFRVAEPEKPLTVLVRRHAAADALKLRVTAGGLMTVFSPVGSAMTSVDLQVEVAEKTTLRMRLPENAQLFNALINGENVSVVRDGDAYLFHVAANSAGNPTAQVRLVYAVTTSQSGDIALLGPRLNIPLENVSWRVVVPPGYRLAGYRGGLRLREERTGGSFSLENYRSLIASKRAADAKQATEYLQAASVLLQRGQQQEAGEVLSRAAKANSLDEASNEDARVQLRELRTQQTVVGLNTRRQRLYLDNSAEAPKNEQLEQAANLNPLMRGKMEFDPQTVDQLLNGNTIEENAALRGIAGRMVDQQLAAEPAPSAIDVNLPERGRVLTFSRSLQVDGDAALELRLDITRSRDRGLVFGIGMLAAFGCLAAYLTTKKKPTAAATA